LEDSHQNPLQLAFPNPIFDPRASQGYFDTKFWVQGGWYSGKQAKAFFCGGLARPGRSRIQDESG
jgi:hypothetical protein